MIGMTGCETAGRKHMGFILRGWGKRQYTGPGEKGTLIQGGTDTRGSTRCSILGQEKPDYILKSLGATTSQRPD